MVQRQEGDVTEGIEGSAPCHNLHVPPFKFSLEQFFSSTILNLTILISCHPVGSYVQGRDYRHIDMPGVSGNTLGHSRIKF